jgi:hypothetical protein
MQYFEAEILLRRRTRRDLVSDFQAVAKLLEQRRAKREPQKNHKA